MTIDLEELADLVAKRVVELLTVTPEPALVSADQLAQLLGVSRATVYAHSVALGALELGAGARPRLRFDPVKAREAWSARSVSRESHTPEPRELRGKTRSRRRPAAQSNPGLLPIRGHPEYRRTP